jgi:tetratricopeptide (TPR) repeat protein
MRLALAIVVVSAGASFAAHTAEIEQARAALNRGDSDAAITVLEKAVAADPKSAEVHYYLGSAYAGKAQTAGMMAGMTYGPKALSEFEQSVALDPKYAEARLSLAEMYAYAPSMMGGSTDKAIEQAKALRSLDPMLAHRAYAVIYTQQKKPELAKKEYLDGIAEQPKSAKAHSYLGVYLANAEKDYAGAFTEFETALKLDPGYMVASYQLGRTASLADSNLARGEASLKRYLGYTPKETEPPLANAHYWLGALYEKQGRKAEAKASYEAALKLNPGLKLASDALKRVTG